MFVFLNLCKYTDEVLIKFHFSLKAKTLQNVYTNGLLVLRKSRKFQPIALIQYFFSC